MSEDESKFVNEHENMKPSESTLEPSGSEMKPSRSEMNPSGFEMGQSEVEERDGHKPTAKPGLGFCRKRSCAAGVLLILLVATFGLGPIDLSFYKSDSTSSYTAGFSSSLEDNSNVRIDFIMDGETVGSHEILTDSSTKTFLKVNIGPLVQEGNRFTPFYKDFKVTYDASFNNMGKQSDCNASDSLLKVKGYVRQIPSTRHVVSIPNDCIMQNGSVNGTMDGEVNIRIMGLCSIKKADELAKAEVIKAVKEYVVGQLIK